MRLAGFTGRGVGRVWVPGQHRAPWRGQQCQRDVKAAEPEAAPRRPSGRPRAHSTGTNAQPGTRRGDRPQLRDPGPLLWTRRTAFQSFSLTALGPAGGSMLPHECRVHGTTLAPGHLSTLGSQPGQNSKDEGFQAFALRLHQLFTWPRKALALD